MRDDFTRRYIVLNRRFYSRPDLPAGVFFQEFLLPQPRSGDQECQESHFTPDSLRAREESYLFSLVYYARAKKRSSMAESW